MFTGIIAELGEVESVEASDEGSRIRIRARLASELETGDSVAVSGACRPTLKGVRIGVWNGAIMMRAVGSGQ